MVRPYSEDLRQRVIAAVEEDNLSCREAARRFRVSVASAVKWLQAWRRSHRARARPMGGDRRSVLKPLRQWLLRLIEREDDLTLVAISGRLMAEHGVKADPSMLSRFIRAEGISYKKSLFASEQDRPDVKRRRERWKRHQGKLDPARLVFIDETWTKTNMTPTRGRCARGERLIAKAPFGKWRTLTFLAALRRDRIEAPILFDGPINGIKFRAYVENALVPTLHPGDVVIMDNLGSHKGRPVRTAIRKAGAHLIFLPPYSLDLNPIEMVFSKLKNGLRKAQARTAPRILEAISDLLPTFTSQECANYLRHAGYASS